MDQYDDTDMIGAQQDNRRKVRLVKNGDPSVMFTCLIKEHINFEELTESICESMEISKREAGQIRVFKTGGVEVFNEDVQYIKNNDILYISFGDEFDESSNFAVFKLVRCLGEGGYGRVYEAKNRISKERVAIKMIDCSKIKNAKDTGMVYKELIALKNLNHRNIVKVYNCYTLQKERKVALILEYLSGGDLREYMNEKKVIPEKEAQKLFTQLFNAIQYCHRESIIHRDLKLENIMFEDKEYERLKVVDFGISGRQSLVIVDHTEAGSVRYLSPEVITQHYPAHPCIDVWAMGCILFWMVTGNSPFPQNTREAVQESIIKGKWSFSPADKKKLTKSVQDLIIKMLTINPQKRITMGEIAEHRWMQYFYEEMQLFQTDLTFTHYKQSNTSLKKQIRNMEIIQLFKFQPLIFNYKGKFIKFHDQSYKLKNIQKYIKRTQMESDEDEKKKSIDLEKQSQHEDVKFDSSTTLAPLKKKNNTISYTPNAKSSTCSNQSSILTVNSSRNPYGILPIRKNSTYTNNSANNSPNMSNNGSQRNIYQYSLFSSNQNISEQKPPENNRLTLPKIEQKNPRRLSYDPQAQQAQLSPQPQSSFNSSRYGNNAFQQNQSQRKGSIFKNTASSFRYESPTSSHKINSPKFKNHAHNNSLSQFNQNSSHNIGFQSQNDFNVVQNFKNNQNVQLMARQQLKMKE